MLFPGREKEKHRTGRRSVSVSLLAVAAVLFFLPAADGGVIPSGIRTAGDVVEPFSCTDLSGNGHTLDSLLDGKEFLVIVFWGVNCGPCLQEFERLNALWAAPRFPGKAAMIAVNTDGLDAEGLREQMEGRGILVGFPVIPDEEQKITNAFVDGLIPLTVLIDRDRRVRFSVLGGGEEGTALLEKSVFADGGVANR